MTPSAPAPRSQSAVVSLFFAFLMLAGLSACADESSTSGTADSTSSAAANRGTAVQGSVVQVTMQDGRFSTLATALDSAGLAQTLGGDGPYTIFAPTDSAFSELPDGTLAELLMPENQDRLATILRYHVVDGSVTAADLQGQSDPLTTLEGSELPIGMSGGTVRLGGEANAITVTEPDVEAENGVIHVIDGVLMPPND